MSEDITNILNGWDFDPDRTYRKIVGDDGREKIQVRVDNAAFHGVLQMELDGRPDGKRPHGYNFALDYHRDALRRFESEHGSDSGFRLDAKSCSELFDESLRIYSRYVFLLQLHDYRRVARDTERNMELFRFVNRYAEDKDDRMNLEKWWPYILRINGTSRALLAIHDEQDFNKALEIVQETREKIGLLEPVDAEEFGHEVERSGTALDELENSIRSNIPLSEKDKLEEKLRLAVTEERYEDAAGLRDRIKSLKGPGAD
ncbi:MAG: UvrB/UvrC motif-containing protein [Gemmatimonadota bacterium]|nr:UvrB/UvrC motif-containing protein [Gemmatimonadota bacterium]